MEYYFNSLDDTQFQKLVGAILVARYGEDIRLTPIRGADGGRDAETAPLNPFCQFDVQNGTHSRGELFSRPRQGRYLFQVKFHRTSEGPISAARKAVIADFEHEFYSNVLPRVGKDKVNNFFLITNVPSSRNALASLDSKRSQLLEGTTSLHADIWWQEQVAAFLDLMPFLWPSYPQLFSGSMVPFIGTVTGQVTEGKANIVRRALAAQYNRDGLVRFQQIELERGLSKLFVNLDAGIDRLDREDIDICLISELSSKLDPSADTPDTVDPSDRFHFIRARGRGVSALQLVLSEISPAKRVVIEGGPGQGKSTIVQMAAQIYRQQLLRRTDIDPEDRWYPPRKPRIPFKIELRAFADWLASSSNGSLEGYLAHLVQQDCGVDNASFTADDIFDLARNSPLVLFLDGLDEVGSNEYRDKVVQACTEAIERLDSEPEADIRVALTTRPPAVAGYIEQLQNFRRFPLLPMTPPLVTNYLRRWLSVQLPDTTRRDEVRQAFERRRKEPHVEAIATNPMQLSVLLHFIKLKGEAFPSQRAELYRDYFNVVIDRDVMKSSEMKGRRELVEALHEFLAFKVHALTEIERADGSVRRSDLLIMVEDWLKERGDRPETARELFRLGEDRLGLIVAVSEKQKMRGTVSRYNPSESTLQLRI